MRRAAISRTTSVIAVVIVVILIAAAVGLLYGSNMLSPATTSTMSSSSSSSSPAVVTTTGASSSTYTGPTQSASLMITFAANPYDAVPYVGINGGFFAKDGLNVTVLTSATGSTGAISAVAAGKADFGLLQSGPLIAAIARGNVTNVKAIASVDYNNPDCVIYNAAKVKTIQDLNGKQVASFTGSAESTEWPIFEKINGINIPLQFVAAGAINSALASQKVDAILQFCYNAVSIAQQGNMTTGTFPFSKYGLNTLGGVLITSASNIQSRPDYVARFVHGYFVSQVYTMNNVPQAMQYFQQSASSWPASLSVQLWNPYIQNTIGYTPAQAATPKNPSQLGWFNSTKMAETINVQVQGLGIPNVNQSAIYTTQFVGTTPPF